jgi:beta-galactosidase
VAPYSSQVALAAGAGVHIHSFTMPMPWPRPGEDYEWTGVDTAVDRTIASDPEALLLPRFGMEPPEWWYEQHPGSEQVFSDGSSEGCSMASEEWRSEAETHLRALVRYCEEKYGDHMLGYHPCGQNTGEWFYRRSWDRVFGDYSPAMLDGFRRYLAERYGDAVDPETVTIPTEEQLLSAAAGWFHDPVAEARLLDYLRYEQIAMVEPLERFARAIKEGDQWRAACYVLLRVYLRTVRAALGSRQGRPLRPGAAAPLPRCGHPLLAHLLPGSPAGWRRRLHDRDRQHPRRRQTVAGRG